MLSDPQSLIILLIVGAIAGWLAGTIVKGYGFGLIGNIIVGIIGAFIGGSAHSSAAICYRGICRWRG
jgi:uncharacterized membrane protein YeaQ/YmgE (transglycosylase-associated protein family)